MLLHTPRFVLRDFLEDDRAAFLAYQTDPRYRCLYDLGEDGGRQAHDLFDRFVSWQREEPRLNVQIGVFERRTGRLCGCAGLRRAGEPEGRAILGIELSPDQWGRYRVAVEVASALLRYGFDDLGLQTIAGRTASGNTRVEKLARWFGADVVARRGGPDWMAARGWMEVDWAVDRGAWERSRPQERRRA
jgi:[ribosomal protein S5]-alanine N-acetyltransferase